MELNSHPWREKSGLWCLWGLFSLYFLSQIEAESVCISFSRSLGFHSGKDWRKPSVLLVSQKAYFPNFFFPDFVPLNVFFFSKIVAISEAIIVAIVRSEICSIHYMSNYLGGGEMWSITFTRASVSRVRCLHSEGYALCVMCCGTCYYLEWQLKWGLEYRFLFSSVLLKLLFPIVSISCLK